jgi:hypothetical protein
VEMNLARWLARFHIICGILILGIHINMIWYMAESGFMCALILMGYLAVSLLEPRKIQDILLQMRVEVSAAQINPKPDLIL